MTKEEQAKEYKEALRYISNAKETLTKAGIDGEFYKDKKYVRTACGTAYNGVLEAVNAWIALKGKEKLKKSRRTIEYYREAVSEERKLLKLLNSAYELLHLYGYYDGTLEQAVVKLGFQRAREIIDYIKPHPQMPSVIASRRRGNPQKLTLE